MGFHQICGLYFNDESGRRYLPQVQLKSHTTISPVCFTTNLTQTFVNSNDAAISQLRYTFPLYDGVAVNGYVISYGDTVIRGVVEQKDQAKKTFKAAVDRGETAGLLESLPAGTFGVTLGNVPAKTDVVVDITYCGELKHDAGIDGLRYMLPTSIAPRYGSYPGELLKANTVSKGGISISIDIDMAGSAIRKVQSPSHPIAVSMGAHSTASGGETAPFSPSQASATLTKGTTELAEDFIFQLLIDDISKPQAILETHPTIPNHRALMTTLVPKFALEPIHPEIVFIADQSGSMQGSKNAALVKALKVFLKSLPLGVRFNICAFGNDFKFLFPKSQAYSEDSVSTALQFAEGFGARYGGTEILKPIKATFEQHLQDLPLEIMLLTDGEIWSEGAVFDYINKQVAEKKVDARVFALGIGGDVSHTLVEGVARAGNGFAQFVTDDEETDQKVMRMLKAALYPHTKDYSMEVHYDDRDEDKMNDEDDDFEIVEKVNDCLKIADPPTVNASRNKVTTELMSFFDTSADLDKPTKTEEPTDRYAHLPAVETPKLLQAPNTIPPLFPFNRTTLYLLLGPETSQKNVSSITLRATSPQGPLELTIPVRTTTATEVATIHQLAARKAIQDLEEGRGWLHAATLANTTTPIKTRHASRFDEFVERECVRLGEKFQVAGKWTSFVAVEDNGEIFQAAEKVEGKKGAPETARYCSGGRTKQTARVVTGGLAPKKKLASKACRRRCESFDNSDAADAAPKRDRHIASGVSLFGAAPRSAGSALLTTSTSAPSPPPPPPPAAATASFSQMCAAPSWKSTAFGAASTGYSPTSAAEEKEESEKEEEMGFGLFDDDDATPASRFLMADSDPDNDVPIVQAAALQVPEVQVDAQTMAQYQQELQDAACMPLSPDEDTDDAQYRAVPSPPAKKKVKSTPTPASISASDTAKMSSLIDLQTFSGAWALTSSLLSLLSISKEEARAVGTGAEETVLATAVAVAWLEKRCGVKREVWEMVAQKARVWLRGQEGGSGEEVVDKVKGLF